MSQFDAATEAADASRGSQQAAGRYQKRTRIFFAEASVALLNLDLSEFVAGIVREDWAGAPWLRRYVLPCRPRMRSAQLREQRDKLMAVARMPMDGSELHERILMAIYCVLTGDTTWPPRYGSHWEGIGFQGNDPATDLRGCGMLALLQMLHLQSKHPKLLQAIFQLSHGARDFPFMVVSITMTQIALQALRCGALTPHINRRKQVDEILHSFHHACFLYMYNAWRQRSLSIHDFGFLKKELAHMAQRRPARLLRDLRAHGAAPAPGKKGAQGGHGRGGFVDLD